MHTTLSSFSDHNKPLKVLAFFDADLSLRNRAAFLRRHIRKGYTLLALGSPALATARRAGVPCTVLGDWVRPEAIADALEQSVSLSRGWFEPARESFTVDGLCIPELDESSMRLFWLNVSLARALAQSLAEHGCSEIKVFRSLLRMPQIGSSRAVPWIDILRAEFPGKITTVACLEPIERATRRLLPNRRASVRHQASAPLNNSAESLPGPVDIPVAVSNAELHRFRDHISALGEEHGDRLAVIVMDSGNSAIRTSNGTPIRVMGAPQLPDARWRLPMTRFLRERPRPDLEERFSKGLETVRSSSHETPLGTVLTRLAYHFDYFCSVRWPMICHQTIPAWNELLDIMNPQLVVMSSSLETNHRLFHALTSSRGIPTAVLPHSAVLNPRFHLLRGNYFLHSIDSQKLKTNDADSEMPRFIQCRELVADSEYPVENIPCAEYNTKLRLLVILDPTTPLNSRDRVLTFVPTLGAQLQALRSPADVPADLKDCIDLRIKVHPNAPDLEMIEAADRNLIERVLPVRSRLHDALRNTDAIIAVNYGGAALVHAYRLGMPVIHLMTETYRILEHAYPHVRRFHTAGPVCRSATELWGTVRKLMTDPLFAEHLSNESARFASEHLNAENGPDLVTVIENLRESHHPGLKQTDGVVIAKSAATKPSQMLMET